MEYLIVGLAVLVAGLGGAALGIFIGIDRMRKAIEAGSVGNLRIDRSEPDEPPKAFWEIVGTNIEAISRRKFVILKVINDDYLTRD